MKRMIESITGGYTSSARVSGNALILTLPDATAPVVWRFDLSHVRSSALEVREQNDKFMLVIKTPRGDSHDVAAFAERGGAVRALMAASRALEGEPAFAVGDGAPSHVAADLPLAARRDELRDNRGRYAAQDYSRRRGGAGKWIFGIIAVAIIAALLLAIRSQLPASASFDVQAGRRAGRYGRRHAGARRGGRRGAVVRRTGFRRSVPDAKRGKTGRTINGT